MPVQQEMSGFAKRLGGGRVAQAHAEHMAAPVDTGNRRLPPGIRDGVARLSAMYTKEQTEDGSRTPRGQVFFRASAIVVKPTEHAGEKVFGLVTQVVIPLCDVPAKGQRKAQSFSENWYEFQNLFKLVGIYPPDGQGGRPLYDQQSDPTGQLVEAYYFAAMKALTDPVRVKTNPVYVSFSTRGWTPPATPLQPKPEEMIFETWHGLAEWDGRPDPAAGVTEGTVAAQPPPMSPPPTQTAAQRAAAPPSVNGPPPQYQPPQQPEDRAELVAALVDAAMGDPEGATEEGASASAQLEELAWAAGRSKEQTAAAADWAAVGEMALASPAAEADAQDETGAQDADHGEGGAPAVGSKWMFAKRGRDGTKLKNNKGEEFPAQQVEVIMVDATAQTCTVKTVKDGRIVADVRTKKPVAVKFEWLEVAY